MRGLRVFFVVCFRFCIFRFAGTRAAVGERCHAILFLEDRIEVVKKLTIGEEIFFVREKDNQYDSNAIKVVNKNNETIGYVTKEKAQEIAPKLDAGKRLKCYINGIYEKKIKVEIHYEN